MSTVPVVRIPPVPALLPGTARPELCLNDRSGAGGLRGGRRRGRARARAL